MARGADPIKIGFGMALTGGLSANGKPALLALQIWKDDVNKKGGLLGRPVELVYYDDQTNPATVPGIYTKLLDVDKVDLVISGYGTNLIAPLMPIAMERKLTLMGMFGLANNEKYQYPNYFQISPTGPDPADQHRHSASSSWPPSRTPSRRRWRSWAPTPSTRRTRWSARAS